MRDLCGRIQFFPEIGAAMRRRPARGGRQVPFTVNPDLFDEVVAHYSLLDSFDAVITSSSLSTRTTRWNSVAGPAGHGCRRCSDTVLIDNVRANIDGWVAAGGKGSLFIDDNTFAEDLGRGKVPVFDPSDVGPR